MRRRLTIALFATGVAGLVAIGTVVAIARYHECRRYHPAWYCYLEMGRH